jgi:tRNA A-37 threonylcarbamoyl transferase component Bud32
MSSLGEGTVLGDRYLILRALKAGGMGVVYEARDQRLANTLCAIKQIKAEVLSDEWGDVARRKFEEEMRFLATLNHPGIPRVRDYINADSGSFLVMDLVEGDNLEQELQAHLDSLQRPLDEARVVDDTIDLLDVLVYMHGQTPPVLHRDIKPANIIRERSNGRVKLVDFGIARTTEESVRTQTQIGTLAYAPMEQIQGHAEPRSDLYALGATMHHLLSGDRSPAFAIPPLEEVRPDIDRALANIIARAVEMNPRDRFASAAAMRQALVDWRAGKREPVASSGKPAPAATATSAPAAPTGPPAARTSALPVSTAPMPATTEPSGTSAGVIGALAGVAALGLVVVGLMWNHVGSSPATTPAASPLVAVASPSTAGDHDATSAENVHSPTPVHAAGVGHDEHKPHHAAQPKKPSKPPVVVVHRNRPGSYSGVGTPQPVATTTVVSVVPPPQPGKPHGVTYATPPQPPAPPPQLSGSLPDAPGQNGAPPEGGPPGGGPPGGGPFSVTINPPGGWSVNTTQRDRPPAKIFELTSSAVPNSLIRYIVAEAPANDWNNMVIHEFLNPLVQSGWRQSGDFSRQGDELVGYFTRNGVQGEIRILAGRLDPVMARVYITEILPASSGDMVLMRGVADKLNPGG